MTVSSEHRDIQGMHTMVRRQRSRSNRRAETRTKNIKLISVTELVSQVPMGWLKAEAPYSSDIQGRMAVSSERRDIQGIHTTVRRQRSRSNRRAETRTLNMLAMVVTELVSQVPMGSLKAAAPYSSTSRDE